MNAVRPYLKAVLPAVLALIGAGVQALVVGTVDKVTIATALTGVLSGVVTFFARNDDRGAA
jgi:hypothetical protein